MMLDGTKIVISEGKENIWKPEKKLIKGHEFELRLVTPNENKANREAGRYRKRGFHTRVIELPIGIFSVYSRHKELCIKHPNKIRQ
jgi:hypothetical protein